MRRSAQIGFANQLDAQIGELNAPLRNLAVHANKNLCSSDYNRHFRPTSIQNFRTAAIRRAEVLWSNPQLHEAGEPPRLSRRPHFLRGWVHGKSRQIFTRSSRASSAHGVRARAGVRIAVGSHEVDWFEDRLHSGNPSAIRTTTLWLNP
jgi:hypothetical protein